MTYFGFREYILDIKNEFTDQGCCVNQIPYLSLKQDDKMSDSQIIQKICESIFEDPENPTKYVMMYILPSNINFIEDLKKACRDKNHRIFVIFYNFGDPESINVDMINYSHGIDLFMTPLEESVDKLSILLDPSTKLHNVPMFVQKIPEYQERSETDKTTDIVIFYHTDHQYIYDMQKIMVEIKHMCIDHDMRIRLYGSPDLEEAYPDIYVGEYNGDNLQQIVNETKLCIFMENNFNNNTSINSVVWDCMKYGGILMIPYNKKEASIAKDQLTCLIYDDKYLEKIFNCVKRYNKFKLIGKQAHHLIESQYSIKVWGKKIKGLINTL